MTKIDTKTHIVRFFYNVTSGVIKSLSPYKEDPVSEKKTRGEKWGTPDGVLLF